MGVQQQSELQSQSSAKYFSLREDVSTESLSDIDSQADINNTGNGGKDYVSPPRLSLWGWYTPSQYRGNSSGVNMKNLSASEDTISLSSLDHQQQPMLMIDSSNSDNEDGASGKDFKIDIHLKEDDDDNTRIKYNTRGGTLRNSSNKTQTTALNNSNKDITTLGGSTNSTSKFLYSSVDQSNGSTIRYPYSPSYSDATFTILCGVVVLFSIVYSLLVGPIQIMFAFLVSILVFISYICASFAANNRIYLYSITALAVGLGLTIPSFFAATGAVVLGTGRDKETWDIQLFKSDQVLMGWMWPKGQMAIFVDESSIVGPDSFIGRLSTEILQLSYISYYIWGYFMEIYILYNLWRCHLSKDPQQQKMMPIWDQRLKMFICSWISTYFIVFSINLIFPAESPRVYIGKKLDLYKNKLTGFGFAGFVRDRIDNAAKGSFGSFPSGHIATSFAIGLSSYKILPAYGFISTIAAILIAIATMYLRYHYFVDFLAALPVTIFCLLYGGFYTPSDFKNVFVNCFYSIKSMFQNILSKFNNK
ncbi:hypothetical protein RB653_007424 [Dictyostelium firmibasis]|uniref:Inositolphosphotransferase Aur1/Ipt1 domain-containing protein n=1 Tax=Dictyostelium firmibasis TaxID=79012 RepID=A0AAN7TVD0_9MYCE